MSGTPFLRNTESLSADASLLLIVDVQERLMPQIHNGEMVLRQCELLLRGAGIFEVPAVVSEQYPRGLSATVPEISKFLPASEDPTSSENPTIRKVDKLRFSAAEATGWPAAGDRDDNRHQVVIAGVETHICVQQTALDLLSQGYRVFVAVDATSSRRPFDHDIARDRLRDSGAIITTVESVLFEWCELAGTNRFRELRDLVKSQSE